MLFGRNGLPVCLEEFPSAWRIMIKTWGRVLLGGIITNEQIQFFFSQRYCNNLNTITLKLFHNYDGIYRFRKKFKKNSGDKPLTDPQKYECASLKLIMKDQDGTRQYVYHFVNPGLRIEILFMKERTTQNGRSILKQQSRKSR